MPTPTQSPSININPPRKRGRPVIEHDNSKVSEFVMGYLSMQQVRDDNLQLDNIITGASLLQPEGQGSSRGLSQSAMLHILQGCKTISTETVREVLKSSYSPATVKRYTIAARVAAKAIERQLALNPAWV